MKYKEGNAICVCVYTTAREVYRIRRKIKRLRRTARTNSRHGEYVAYKLVCAADFALFRLIPRTQIYISIQYIPYKVILMLSVRFQFRVSTIRIFSNILVFLSQCGCGKDDCVTRKMNTTNQIRVKGRKCNSVTGRSCSVVKQTNILKIHRFSKKKFIEYSIFERVYMQVYIVSQSGIWMGIN